MKPIRIVVFFLSSLFAALLLGAFNPSPLHAQVVINEVMPNPAGTDSDNEWLELYNTSNVSLDLNGYSLKDAAGATLPINIDYVDSTTQIGGNGFLVIRRNNHTTFSLNNDQDTIYLFDLEDDLKDTFGYVGSTEEKTWGRIPDGGTIFAELLTPTPGQSNQPIPTSTPTSSPSSTSTPTSTPSQSQATVSIKDAKDEDGNVLNVVKIYIDGIYTNHYTPEELKFCDGCKCNNAVCGYGTHTFKFEKSGFQTFEVTHNISAGQTIDISPILDAENVSSNATTTPLVSVLATSTASPENSDSPFSVSLPLSATPTGESEDTSSVLGIQGESQVDSKEDEKTVLVDSSKKMAGAFFLLSGLVLLGYPLYILLKKYKKTRASI